MDDSTKNITAVEMEQIYERMRNLVEPCGLEAYPFKVGWYNNSVKKPFHLQYDENTIAFVILSVPSMFEKCLIPFIKDDRYDCLNSQDPLDQCMKEVFQKVKNGFSELKVVGIHDYEVHPNRRPKILVQTAGHVAGAAYYYQQVSLKTCPVDRKLYGVSLHPRYGGWFAFRGTIIFENILCLDFLQKDPEDVLKTDELKLDLLKKFNHNWKDWSYRDIVKPDSTYSEEQKLFFITPPAERTSIIQSLKSL